MPLLGKKAIHTIEYTLVIGGSFYLGMTVMPFFIGRNNNLASAEVKEFGPILDRMSNKDLLAHLGETRLTIKGSEIKKWIEVYTRNYSGKEDKRISYKLASEYLSSIALKTDSGPVNAKLKFQNNRATVFVPSSSGKKLNIDHSYGNIVQALVENNSSVSLAFDIIEPEVTLEKINNLGINMLLGTGTSDYGKSPSSRINNIKIGMSKFNGIILKPGEKFSFNEILGSVEESEGYQAELVIKNGQLVREFGGGLCQVSTTIFRSAVLAGLPINERKSHSFPVQYYNPQGFDSTIYPGVVDLKFTNDTANHILIQTRLTGSRLNVEIYGSDTGRKVVVEGPVQYDQKPDGSMKAYFMRKIYNGEQLAKEERFNSIYKAPPASPLEKNPLE